jgi:hypothetical protein
LEARAMAQNEIHLNLKRLLYMKEKGVRRKRHEQFGLLSKTTK